MTDWDTQTFILLSLVVKYINKQNKWKLIVINNDNGTTTDEC